jgi:hypothetical protein
MPWRVLPSGELLEVTKAEFDAWNTANGLPTIDQQKTGTAYAKTLAEDAQAKVNETRQSSARSSQAIETSLQNQTRADGKVFQNESTTRFLERQNQRTDITPEQRARNEARIQELTAEKEQLAADAELSQTEVAAALEGKQAAEEERKDAESRFDETKSAYEEVSDLEDQEIRDDELLADAADPTATIKITDPDLINDSESDAETEAKYADPNNTPNEDPFLLSGDDYSNETDDFDLSERYAPSDSSDESYAKENRSGVPVGAERSRSMTKASADWAETKDLRAILRVPQSYLKGPAAGPGKILNDFGGILFPYTPTISYDNQAQYGSVNPVHSNYTQYYFKSSQVGQISISAKFTVQNEKEGKVWLGIVHLLRSLTKMRWGKDSNAGSPPPVCRLEAYGDYVLRNVPVVISSFKFDLPDNVDYISVGGEYKNSLVPSITTFNIGLNVMYSRREMQDYSVDDWIAGDLRGQGYL